MAHSQIGLSAGVWAADLIARMTARLTLPRLAAQLALGSIQFTRLRTPAAAAATPLDRPYEIAYISCFRRRILERLL